MSNYIVVIPSYKRSKNISDKTLHVLNSKKVSPKNIFIFVANEEEKKDYAREVDKKLYNKLIVGVKGLRNQRNFITKYYPNGKHIVELDDDIEEVSQMIEGKTKEDRKLKPVNNLDAFFKDAFKKCAEYGAYLWGVYPVYNAFFMSKKITHDLRFVVGPLWGKINRHDKDLVLHRDEKEDVERTLRHYDKDKSVIRFNDIAIKTKFYTTPGGYQAANKDRKKEALKSAKYLARIYPRYATLWLGKKSRHPEVRLRDKDDGSKLEERYTINKKKYYGRKRCGGKRCGGKRAGGKRSGKSTKRRKGAKARRKTLKRAIRRG